VYLHSILVAIEFLAQEPDKPFTEKLLDALGKQQAESIKHKPT